MFFSKLFSRGGKSCREKGDKLFSAGSYAEARVYYQDALHELDTAGERNAEQDYLLGRLSVTGNLLAEMNIVEAETALRINNLAKAEEHLQLALELADDVTIREKAANHLDASSADAPQMTPASLNEHNHNCAGCSSTAAAGSETPGKLADAMDREQQFQLLVNTLPFPLQGRYETMGREFATAYLLAHDEQLEAAQPLFTKLLLENETDIVLYELAVVEYRRGNVDACEKLLDRALLLNDSNPLCYLTIAQLYAESKRYPKAVTTLQQMIERDFLPEQAAVMLGDVYTVAGNTEGAIEIFSQGLQIPALKKVAAERLVAILGSLNRPEEAAFIEKSYLKGCC